MRGGGGKRKIARRSRSSFRWLAATLGLPLVAAALLLFWSWSRDPSKFPGAGSSSTVSPAAVAPHAAAPPDWTSRLDAAGVDRSTVRSSGDRLTVEYPGEPRVLVERLNEQGTSASAGPEGLITLRSGSHSIDVRVHTLTTEDSGLGLVEAAPEPGGTGRIVLILDDVGFERQPLERAAAIDPDIAFAVIPTASRARSASEWLGARGFELLCHLPMEPDGWPTVRVDEPAIMIGMSDEQIRRTTDELVRNIPGAVGVNNHMGSRASSDPRVMRSVMQVIRDRGMYFLDSRTTASSLGERTARELGVRSTSRQVFLDDDPSRAAVRIQLRALAELSRREGVSVGIGHLLPGTVEVLEKEIPLLRAEGFRIVRPSTVVH